MGWTQAELEALERDRRAGVSKVKYEDREVEYRSDRDLARLLEEGRRKLGQAKRGRRFTLSRSSKGL